MHRDVLRAGSGSDPLRALHLFILSRPSPGHAAAGNGVLQTAKQQPSLRTQQRKGSLADP